MTAYEFSAEADRDLEGIVEYTRERWGDKRLQYYLTALEMGITDIVCGRRYFKEIMRGSHILRVAHIEHHYVFLKIRPNQPALVEGIFHERMDFMAQLADRMKG